MCWIKISVWILVSWATVKMQVQGQSLYLIDSEDDLMAMSSEILDIVETKKISTNASVLVTRFNDYTELDNSSEDTKPLNYSRQINCFPFSDKLEYPNDSENDKADLCRKNGCEWYPRGLGKNWKSYCFTPKSYGYFGGIVKGVVKPGDWGYEVVLDKNGLLTGLGGMGQEHLTYFGNDSEYLRMVIEFESDERLHIKITDKSPEDVGNEKASRWEVPLPINPSTKPKSSSRLYDVKFEYVPVFSFKVIRKSSGTVIFDTSLGGFTFSEQFIQIAIKLPSKNLYGFGEHEQTSFKHNFDELDVSSWPMYSREIGPTRVPFTNFGGVHPYYTVVEPDGNTHSVMILNSNAQEIQLLPIPGLIYRTIGGILDLYIFMGPTPLATVQQYTEAVGRPFLPSYHSLGFHISRSPFTNFGDLKEMIERVQQAEIPFDNIHGGLGILDDYKTFTLNERDFKELPEFINGLKGIIHFSVSTNPLISTDNKSSYYYPLSLGNEVDIWIKNKNGTPVKGYYELVGDVYYPDFSKPSITFWWKSVLENYRKLVNFEGIHLDRNQPYNFGMDECLNNKLNNPPYLPKIRGSMSDGTICPDVQLFGGSHYDYHSLYGLKQSEITFKTLLELDGKKRPFITSKATYHGSGQWVGHFLQDSYGTWTGLQLSIIKMLQFNQFGIPFVGSNICSFTELEEISEELCLRWTQLGAFYPLSRNHNEKLAQDLDPAAFNETTTKLIKKALQLRYSLLPYLYTLFYEAHTQGNTVVRSLWHEFPKDPITYDIDRQFFWGRSLMIVPILEPEVTVVEAYIPKDRWYDFRTRAELSQKGTYVDLDAKLDTIPVLIRGYSVIPIQEPGVNTKMSRNNPFNLIIALCPMGNGEGQLFYDDGVSPESIKSGNYFLARYKVQNKTLTATVQIDGYLEMSTKILSTINLLGAGNIQEIQLNGKKYENWKQISKTSEIRISELNLPVNTNFTVRWIN